MRDLHSKNKRLVPVNRVKKASKPRKPINWRPLAKGVSILTCAGLLLGGAVIGGKKLYRTVAGVHLLQVKSIEVSPLKRLTRAEVLTLAGVRPGDPLYRMPLKGMVEQISRNPWVEQVRVRRYLPDTINIAISEREPKAVANVGCLYYLDAKGNLFKALAEGDSLDYPLITGISEEDLARDPAGSKEAFVNALELIGQLRGGQVFSLADVSEIHYDRGYGFTLFTMQNGVPVKLGNSGFSEKLARLSRIYRELQGEMQALDYVDLDYSDKIIVKKG